VLGEVKSSACRCGRGLGLVHAKAGERSLQVLALVNVNSVLVSYNANAKEPFQRPKVRHLETTVKFRFETSTFSLVVGDDEQVVDVDGEVGDGRSRAANVDAGIGDTPLEVNRHKVVVQDRVESA